MVLERPANEDFVTRWQLACEEDIAHVVVMPNVTREKADVFVRDLADSIKEHGRTSVMRPDSPLAMLADPAWGGSATGAASEAYVPPQGLQEAREERQQQAA